MVLHQPGLASVGHTKRHGAHEEQAPRAEQTLPPNHKHIPTAQGVQKADNYPHQTPLHCVKISSLARRGNGLAWPTRTAPQCGTTSSSRSPNQHADSKLVSDCLSPEQATQWPQYLPRLTITLQTPFR